MLREHERDVLAFEAFARFLERTVVNERRLSAVEADVSQHVGLPNDLAGDLQHKHPQQALQLVEVPFPRESREQLYGLPRRALRLKIQRRADVGKEVSRQRRNVFAPLAQ